MNERPKRDARAGINIKIRPELRARADMCATLEGLTTPEFIRAAIVAHCERMEKLVGQRSRAMKAAMKAAKVIEAGSANEFNRMTDEELNAEAERLRGINDATPQPAADRNPAEKNV